MPAETIRQERRLRYRGRADDGGEFTDDATGEVRPFTPALKFEWYDEDGHIHDATYRMAGLEKAEPDFDIAELEPGDELVLVRELVLFVNKDGDRGWFESIAELSKVNGTP
jgi:hypothetical protein